MNNFNNNISGVLINNVGDVFTSEVGVKEKKVFSKSFYIDLDSFLDFNVFIKKLSMLKFGHKYIILTRLNYKREGDNIKEGFIEWKTLGNQIIIRNLSTDNYESEMEYLQNAIIQRLEYSMDKYKYKELDIVGVQLIVYKCDIDVVVKKTPKLTKESFGEQRDLVNMTKLSTVFNKIYTTGDINRFGVLLEKEVVDGFVKSITLLDGSKVDFQKCVDNYSTVDNLNITMNFYQKEVSGIHYILAVETLGDLEWSVHIYNIRGMKIQHIIDKIMDSNNICRKIGNVCFYIDKNNEIYKKEVSTTFPPIYANKIPNRLARLTHPDHKFGTLDLETYKSDNKSYVYALGFYTKNDLRSFYLNKDLDSDDLIYKCLTALLVDKYNGYTFYVHNLAGFDIYFILPALSRLNKKYSDIFEYKDSIVFRDDEEIISIKISMKVKTDKSSKVISIKLVDSFKLFSASLESLCETFETNITKSYFPYNFVKKQTLFYEGEKPALKYYESLDLDIYNSIPQENWGMEKETLFYLEKDLISLYEVMEKFIKSIYINYHVHAISSLTISSLSMNIFLRRYYDNNIPLIKERSIFNDIKESYYGGITEVYKPYGQNLFYYDVNSLYPYAALNPMPGLNCVFVDNIYQSIEDIKDLFGFYYCEVECYKGYIGLLSVRTEKGIIQPLGKFKGWYFSEELKFAHENGYKIHIIKGYHFDKSENVFTKYFTELYDIKSHSTDSVERALAKSKLNNLIGKLGSSIDKYITKIVSEEELLGILQTRKYRGVKYLDKDVLVTFDKDLSENICEQNGVDYKKALFDIVDNYKKVDKEERFNNVSIAVASAITAYARITINKTKLSILNKGGSIYYSDTDSIVTDIKLDDEFVGTKIGQFKLEHEIREGYFISNKTYSFIDINNKVQSKNKGVFVNKKNKDIITPFEDDKDYKSLSYVDFKNLYLGEDVKTFRYESSKNISLGYVNLKVPSKLTLSTDSYTKRIKIIHNKKWVDTKPIIMDNSKKYHTSVQPEIVDSNNSGWMKRYVKIFFNILDMIYWGVVVIFFIAMYTISTVDETMDDCNSGILELLELRYKDDCVEENLDDCVEENLDLDGNISINKDTFIDRFINLFRRDSDNSNIIPDYKQNSNLKSVPVSDKSNIVEELYKEYLNDAYTKIDNLQKDLSLLEIEYIKYRVEALSIISDAVRLGREAKSIVNK